MRLARGSLASLLFGAGLLALGGLARRGRG
jgi:hypothetical protein